MVLGAVVALNCGGSPDDSPLFDSMDSTLTGGATLGGPTATNAGGASTTTTSSVSSNGDAASTLSTTTSGAGGTLGQGGSAGVGGSNGGDAGATTGTPGGSSAGGSSTGGSAGIGGSSATESTTATEGTTATQGTTGTTTTTGDVGSTSSSSGGGSSGGAGGTDAEGGAAGAGGAGGVGGCGLGFEARPNTVYFALDRSSSMIDENFWDPVKEGVLDSVAAMQDRMRFGFAAFTGQSGLTCPLDLTAAADIRLENLAGISAVLDPLEPPDPEGVKGETPTAAAIAAVREKLALDASPGKVYVLLITDGDPDFCDDRDAVCPSDALVYELQAAYLEGVETRVFNIAGGAATASRLEAFARAGRGLAVRGNSQNIYDSCLTDATWAARLSELGGGEGDSLGNYVGAAPAGSYVTLDPGDAAALSTTLADATATLLSCLFDLEGGPLAEGEEAAVSVELAGEPLSYGDADGWTLHSGSLLELTGEACKLYRSASAPELDISIDCDVLE